MARTWLVDSRGIAKKVKNSTNSSTYQIKDCGIEAYRNCPNCSHLIDNSDVSLEWPGLPAGVKFDPSDAELLEHLAGKVGLASSKPHLFLDEFIPTLQEDEGICYTHPENLPGIKKDGTSVHFFHRTSNAYATGQRKRRKIHSQCCLFEVRVRWHKTGRTRPIIENGIQKGWKKIMVLYKSSKKGSRPDKDNWVMHQYHLGTEEDEREGELVVSKIFYQHQLKNMTEKSYIDVSINESDMISTRVSPRTPKTHTPHPPRLGKRALHNEIDDEKLQCLPYQDTQFISEIPETSFNAICLEDESANPMWWAGESQGIEEANLENVDDLLLCKEILDFHPPFLETEPKQVPYVSDVGCSRINTQVGDTKLGFLDIENIEDDTPPDFQLADLQFGSQESITSWLERL